MNPLSVVEVALKEAEQRKIESSIFANQFNAEKSLKSMPLQNWRGLCGDGVAKECETRAKEIDVC